VSSQGLSNDALRPGTFLAARRVLLALGLPLMAAAPQRHRFRLSMRARLNFPSADKQCSLFMGVTFTLGRTEREPWNYFMYAYEEASGQPVKDPSKTLSFREVSRTPTSRRSLTDTECVGSSRFNETTPPHCGRYLIRTPTQPHICRGYAPGVF
jgi:hypothetical protein